MKEYKIPNLHVYTLFPTRIRFKDITYFVHCACNRKLGEESDDLINLNVNFTWFCGVPMSKPTPIK